MAGNEFTYPYNPNGVLEECNVVAEPHTITPSSDRNYNWFIPFAAPFFGFSVVLKHVASGKTLQRGIDYNLGLEYHQFNTQVTLRPVYGAIILIDTSLTGSFTIDYMTIGGAFAINQAKALSYMANAQIDPRTTQWDSVTDIPSQFPVTQHLHDAADIIGMSDVVTAINALTAAMLSGGGKWFQSLTEHLNDFNDPHHVLDMIPGGGGGEAIPKATQQMAIDGTDNVAYATILRVAQYCAANVTPTITNHINDKNNPHDVDKTDVGLSQVVNLPMATNTDVDGNTNPTYYASLAVAQYAAQKIVDAYNTSYVNNMATQLEAEAGTNNTKWVSILRVAQFVAKGVGADLAAHVAATGNVHNLQPDDIGLGNVPNYRATVQSDIDGQVNLTNTLTTPAMAKVIAQKVLAGIDAGSFLTQDDLDTYMSTNFGNVPNFGIANGDDVLTPTANDKLMTPYLSKVMIDQFATIQIVGICDVAADVATYKGQSTSQQLLLDLPNNQVFEYSEDDATWVVNADITLSSVLLDGAFYINPVTYKGFKVTDGTTTPPTVQKLIDPGTNVTVSTSAPPTDTTGLADGHVWYQVS